MYLPLSLESLSLHIPVRQGDLLEKPVQNYSIFRLAPIDEIKAFLAKRRYLCNFVEMKRTGEIEAKRLPIVRTVRETVRGIPEKGPLLVCVSGGADSVALLRAVLLNGFTCEVANCNFHLRGEESDRDSYFVTELCSKLGVKLHRFDFDTIEYCRANNVSVEMGCRKLRYRAFRDLKKAGGFSRIMVAHNADDNIETLLLNLFRGTGLKGLTGMTVDTGEILRPLLSVTRNEIEQFLAVLGEEYVVDSSNSDDSFRRNFIRRRLLPLIEERWPGARKALTETIGNLKSAESFCVASASRMLEDDSLVSAQLAACPELKNELLFRAFSPKGASSVQLREMCNAVRPGAHWRLPEGEVRLLNEGYRYMPFSSLTPESFRCETVALIDIDFDTIIKGDRSNSQGWFPGEQERYEWTTLSAGLRFAPFGMKGSRKVTDMLRDARVPATLRSSYPILIDRESKQPLWIPFVARSRHSLVSPSDNAVTHIFLPTTNPLTI